MRIGNYVTADGPCGVGPIQLTGRTEKGERVAVLMSREKIIALADALKANPSCVGHATWHFLNPDSPMPCPMCNTH